MVTSGHLWSPMVIYGQPGFPFRLGSGPNPRPLLARASMPRAAPSRAKALLPTPWEATPPRHERQRGPGSVGEAPSLAGWLADWLANYLISLVCNHCQTPTRVRRVGFMENFVSAPGIIPINSIKEFGLVKFAQPDSH